MSNKLKKVLLSLGVIALLIGAFFAYKAYRYNDFKRAYETGTTFEQLDTLMNSTRYVEAVRAAGYEVDNSDVFMYGIIPWLVIDKATDMTIYSPGDFTFIVRFTTILDESQINVYFRINKEFTIEASIYHLTKEDGSNGTKITLSDSEESQLLEEVKEKVQTMLDAVYKAAYD